MRAETLARLLVLGLAAAAVGFPLAARQRPPLLHARLAEQGGWAPDVLRAEAGQPLTVRLTSDDVLHGFGVGRTDFEAVLVEPGKVTEVTLTFDQPGIYTYYCTVWCGLNHWRMRGVIEVRGSDVQAGAPTPPLYAQLGIDIDAPHPAETTPAERPNALAAPVVALEFSFDQYAAASPAQLWSSLGNQPGLENLTDAQRWDLVAALWARQTSPAALAEGETIFRQDCAACHGPQGAGDGLYADDLASAGQAAMQGLAGAPDMLMQSPPDWQDPAILLGASPALLQGKLLRGGMGTGMPMWGAIYTDEQLWHVVAYLYTLQMDYP
ncbi:MAG: c-type cytochrome [Chloroflexi bacterium]|nr:c-type cytochrome [Chloroflexota bacterium]